jgi:hypothetical protein
MKLANLNYVETLDQETSIVGGSCFQMPPYIPINSCPPLPPIPIPISCIPFPPINCHPLMPMPCYS